MFPLLEAPFCNFSADGEQELGLRGGGAFQLSAGSAIRHPDLGSLVSPVSDPLTSCQVLSFSLHCSGKQDLYSDGKTLELVYSPCRHDELMGIKDFVLIGKFSVLHPHSSLTQFILMVSHEIYSLTIPEIAYHSHSAMYIFLQSKCHWAGSRCQTKVIEMWSKDTDSEQLNCSPR